MPSNLWYRSLVSAQSYKSASGAPSSSPVNRDPPGNPNEKTQNSQMHAPSDNLDPQANASGNAKDTDRKDEQNNPAPRPLPLDLAEAINGMYRLLDLISESGSNGCVDKVIIAQDSLKRFINATAPGTYASITKVDFKALDRLMIKPLGVYGSKDEIVRLLRSINAVTEDVAQLLLAPTEVGGFRPVLSSGLYIVAVGPADSTEERHYVIYWPEDATWDDSATSSVSRNRVTFMRYLTKICDQVVALLSFEHSASIVWTDEDSDTESVDVDVDDSDRLFTFEVAKTKEQKESASSRPGFQMKSPHISCHGVPADCSVDPSIFVPRLLRGETAQAFWTVTYIPRQTLSEIFDQRQHNHLSLKKLLDENALVLSEALDENAVQIVVDVAIANTFSDQCCKWHGTKNDIHERFRMEMTKRQEQVSQDLAREENSLRRTLREAIVGKVISLFPAIQPDSLSSHVPVDGNFGMNPEVPDRIQIDNLRHLYPDFDDIYQQHIERAKFKTIKGSDFKSLKERLTFVRHLLAKHQHLSSEKRAELIQAFISEGDLRHAQKVLLKSDKNKESATSSWFSKAKSIILSVSKGTDEESLQKEMKTIANDVTDSDFLLELKTVDDEDLKSAIQEASVLAHTRLSSSIDTVVKKMTPAILRMQQDHCKKAVQREIESEQRKVLGDALVEFIREINANSAGQRDSVVYLDGVEKWGKGYYHEYKVMGRTEAPQEAKLEFRVHLMDLTSDDKHSMRSDHSHIPEPAVSDQRSPVFYLPIGLRIVFSQLLENERLLLVLADRDKHSVYLERLSEIDAVIQRARPIKLLHHNKVGEHVLFAFDEAKRMLAVCAPTKLHIYAFVFDETFKSLQGQGGVITLAPWYSQAEISILQLSFVCGNDEVALVDSTAQVRIFSFITLQFRPASLQLRSPPSAVYSSPDGSCLLVLQAQGPQPSLIAYHWETFGSTDGISLEVPEFPLEGAVFTSMVRRGCIFLLSLDIDAHSVKSITIDIKRKVTEFRFKEKGSKNTANNDASRTLHNSTLDCLKEVWTRFPVLAAVRRRTITSSSEQRQKSLTFITERPTGPFALYFSDLIQTFEKATKKPTGDELRRIEVSATNFESFQDKVVFDSNWNVSRYRVGEWLVDLLCLIPIHIAVCRENRFVPLANGVLSAELERSLLGADVNRIVDKLSFGWYESIFQSYMALKPVKVVSSMGQQSVGKSFSLNHLVDTSFAGSAMRTTEGVWMSVTPTDEELIVALDFEGVDSVERSPQEDALLVLFNTAISNLVLFRNNFALSRDISGLFQSFQSSASVLDPAANPSLFQSTLVIIIKDVVEPDKNEITREFSSKFQKIVEEEQDANFISRLHGGKLDIIPWPVIESKEFYKLFAILKRRLDLQNVSYPTAGEFLHTIKTLMAKLKANDWGALSQTMAEHRAKSLTALLPIALATGFSETEPDFEHLKDFDTDLIVESDDTDARFAISECEQIPSPDIEMHLAALLELSSPRMPRQSVPDSEWMAELASCLNRLIDLRVGHVRAWLDCNLERFQGGHAAIGDLRRTFDNKVIEMKTNVQLCGAQCFLCHLLCVRSRFHEGDHSCKTNHGCAHKCGFCEGDLKPCGTPAGHPGKHICVVNTHLCGGPCKLSGKRGCLEECTKVEGHAEDDHMCSALVHMCGEPCALKGMKLPDGKTYSCPENCSIPSDQEHKTHSCDTRLCPRMCELCKRLCDRPHLHGLTAGVHHLCGEAHPCSALCSAPGICQIDTAPHSVEATFTGRHETFQYTKYTQVAKRLQCVRVIPPGQMSHMGSHSHSPKKRPFHFCETRCENCSYFCTLPLGHAQQEHETSHGSMTQTRWAVDGPDGTTFELGGRRFSSNDDGAPMMCNIVCSSMGRHVHIDYCRTEERRPCDGAEVQHINTRMIPNPEKPKDAITHGLYWRRMGFKGHEDISSVELITEIDNQTRIPAMNRPAFQNGTSASLIVDEPLTRRRSDAMCSGPEHSGTAAGTGQPSYCILPMFHSARNPNDPVDGLGYISNDGHLFECNNPVVMQQAFHVIFVIDRSGSMSYNDRRPLANAPATNRIRQLANNRLGAVYSALYSFWSARHAATTAGRQTIGVRRDAYSVILFNEVTTRVLTNDFMSSPDQLLGAVLSSQAHGGTNFSEALLVGQAVMEENWSTERTPVMIFLSDGECSVPDMAIQDLCRSAVRLGKPLSFHSVSFGPDSSSSSLRRMANLALGIQNNAPRDPLRSPAASVPSSFAIALDTVRLAETFLGIAESLRKPRGSLMR
ncbi:hypothetical protein BJV78DRAFT_526274 [Lactifluus subvellereus]|nr:hypothetical protein BJV78DRAFT_526274 [Lactifluus subvellereus]